MASSVTSSHPSSDPADFKQAASPSAAPGSTTPTPSTPQSGPRHGQRLTPEDFSIGALFWHIRDAVSVTDARDGTIVLWNPAAEAIFGFTANEAVGRSSDLMVPEEQRADILSELEQFVRTGHSRITDSVTPMEFRLIGKDGREMWIESTITPMDPRTHPHVEGRYLLSVSRDVTARKHDEEALRRAAVAQTLLLESARAILWRADASTLAFSYVSLEAEKLLGFSREAWTREPDFWVQHIYPKDREMAVARCLEAASEQTNHEFEYRMIAADGRVVWLRDIVAVLVEEGEAKELIGVMVDVTEDRRMREQLDRANRQRELILTSVGEGIYGLDRQGHTTFANPAAARLTGHTIEELLGQPQHELVHHSYADGTPYPAEACPIHRSILTGTPAHVQDEVFWHKDGSSFPVEYTSTPIEEDGEVVGAVVAFRDITERRRAEEQLAQRAQELARSNADLEQFAYVASHDLQEPLRTVVSYLQLIEEDYRAQLGVEGKEFLDFAVDGAKRMQRLINDLLVYSRIGRRGQPLAPVHVETVVEEVLADLEASIRDSKAQITHDPLPVVRADAVQLAQVFRNLLSNAVKFHGSAPPRIHIGVEHLDDDEGMWRFCVRDNGIGIDPEYRELIFVIFQRLHVRDEYPGTGIGLAVCKKIVERHGGRMWVESAPGEGSTFYFTLPDAADPEDGNGVASETASAPYGEP